MIVIPRDDDITLETGGPSHPPRHPDSERTLKAWEPGEVKARAGSNHLDAVTGAQASQIAGLRFAEGAEIPGPIGADQFAE